jgi:hypothetical protein
MRQGLSFAFVIAAAAVLGACGNSSHGSSAGPGDSGSGGDAVVAEDAGDDGSGGGYPAFPVDAPQIRKNQGAILASPVVVTVSWPGDTNASTWEAFGDALGASSYWSATTAEYGVAPAKSGPSNHVRMTQPLPPSLSYYDVENYVIATLQGAAWDGGAPDAGAPSPPWPAPTLDASGHSQTIYSLFIPPSTTETDPGTGTSFCGLGGFGYHDLVTVGSTSVVFSVTLECPGQTAADLEETAAHEYVEAATNPNAGAAPLGYVGFDDNHVAWDIYSQFNDELADACQNWQDSYYQDTGSFPYWVQRSWSNTAALAGHDPCVPAAAGPYQGMTLFPSEESKVTVNATAVGGGMTSTLGFKATLGQPLTFQVGYFSDASAAPWKIAYDFPASLSDTMGGSLSNGKATVTIDKTSGQNGDKANVTVTVTAKGGAGFHVMAITWDPPTSKMYLPHYLPLVIVDQ